MNKRDDMKKARANRKIIEKARDEFMAEYKRYKSKKLTLRELVQWLKKQPYYRAGALLFIKEELGGLTNNNPGQNVTNGF